MILGGAFVRVGWFSCGVHYSCQLCVCMCGGFFFFFFFEWLMCGYFCDFGGAQNCQLSVIYSVF